MSAGLGPCIVMRPGRYLPAPSACSVRRQNGAELLLVQGSVGVSGPRRALDDRRTAPPRPTQQRAREPSGAPGLLLFQEAGVCSRRARSHVNATCVISGLAAPHRAFHRAGLVGQLRGGDGRTISNCWWSSRKGSSCDTGLPSHMTSPQWITLIASGGFVWCRERASSVWAHGADASSGRGAAGRA